MTQHPLKDVTFVYCTEKPHVFPSESSSGKWEWFQSFHRSADIQKQLSSAGVVDLCHIVYDLII